MLHMTSRVTYKLMSYPKSEERVVELEVGGTREGREEKRLTIVKSLLVAL